MPAWRRRGPRSRFCHVPGFAAGRRPNAGSCRLDPAPPARPRRAVHRVCQNIAGRLRRGPDLGAARHRRAAPLDDRGRVQRNLRAVPFPPRSEYRQSLGGVRLALSRHSRRRSRLCRAGRPADADRDHARRGLCPLWRDRRAAADARGGCLRRGRSVDRGRVQDDHAVDREARWGRTRHARRGVRCHRLPPPAVTDRAAGGDSGEPCRHHFQRRPKA